MEGYFMHVSKKVAEARFGKEEEEEKVYSVRELKTWKFWRAVMAEFVGTMLFVFLGCASTLTNPVNPVRVSSLLEMTLTGINLSPPLIQIKKKINEFYKRLYEINELTNLAKGILFSKESSIPTASTKKPN